MKISEKTAESTIPQKKTQAKCRDKKKTQISWLKKVQQTKKGDSDHGPEYDIFHCNGQNTMFTQFPKNTQEIKKNGSSDTAYEKCQKRSSLWTDKISH